MAFLLDTSALLWVLGDDPRPGPRTRSAIEDRHLLAPAELPLIHRDPFDLMLIAQAQVEGLTVVTSDAVFAVRRPGARRPELSDRSDNREHPPPGGVGPPVRTLRLVKRRVVDFGRATTGA